MVTGPVVTLLEVLVLLVTEAQLPPVLAHAVNVTVPPTGPDRVYAQTMDNVAPALRVRLAGTGAGLLTTAPPAVTVVGLGEGMEVTTRPFVEDLFVTVMVRSNLHPEPMFVGAGTNVICRAFQVQELVSVVGL
jgi:hypothetical protein